MDRVTQGYAGGEMVIVIDCSDLGRAARFWCEVLGYVVEGEITPSQHYQSLYPADRIGIEILLQRVSDAKMAKNRLHLDLRTADLDREVQRLREVGATLLSKQALEEHGWRWHVLADPDGNEFCVLQSPSPMAQSEIVLQPRSVSAATEACCLTT
jgi:predicted enzyme related to lactoylglutathione lyase